ncbi:hypothetical protein OTU49_009929, partial [Cherax quadricarinatus]
RGRGRGRGRGIGRGQGSSPNTSTPGPGVKRPRGRPRKIIPIPVPTEEPDSDDGLSLDVDTDEDSQETDTDEEVIAAAEHSGNCSRDYRKSPSPAQILSKPPPSQPTKQGFSEGSQIAGLQISLGTGFSRGGTPVKGRETSPHPVSSPTPVLPSSVASSSPIPGIQITIPGLSTCSRLPLGGVPSATPVPSALGRTPLTSEARPFFGVPVPVITSVHALQNRLPVSNSHTLSAQSRTSSNNQVDEDYDS